MNTVGLVFFYVALAVITGVAANTRGRNPFAWAVLALIFSPILAGLLLFALPKGDGTGDSGVTVLKWMVIAIGGSVAVILLVNTLAVHP
jgi:Mn2+/Fe2+ NRAMP family transporter